MCDPAGVSEASSVGDYLMSLTEQLESLADASVLFTRPIWSRRVVLPCFHALDGGAIREVSNQIDEAAPSLGVGLVAFPLGVADIDQVADGIAASLSETESTFISLKLSEMGRELTPDRAEAGARLLARIAEKGGPANCARFAFSCGDQPETPYFPDTSSQREGFTLSLRYVPDLQSFFNQGRENVRDRTASLLKAVESEALAVSRRSSIDYIGVDCSLSPWMEESAADLVGTVMGSEFGGPGTHHATSCLNRLIGEASQGLRTCGFNEVMLPVAEDSELKELALEGRIDVSTLVSLVSICVAGLDMVALPLSTEPRSLARLLQDVSSIANAKGRPAGIRLVLADGKPGGEVEMGQFGRVPIMKAC